MLGVDSEAGKVVNRTSDAVIPVQPLSPDVIAILENGGIKPMIRKQMGGLP